MKKIGMILIVFIMSLLSPTYNNGETKQNKEESYFKAIKTARYWTSPIIRPENIKNLAQSDLLIVDVENMFNNYNYLVQIKKLNPNLKLICYTNPMEIWMIKYNNRPWQNSVIDEITNHRSEWILRKGEKYDRSLVRFWPNMIMLNFSTACPREKWQRYYSWMARKLNHEVLSDTIWDGYFMDNCTSNISWVSPGKIDINNNREADNDQRIDKSWEIGVKRFLRRIRRSNGQDFIIIGNKGDHYFLDIVDGKKFENFPNPWLGDTWADGFKQSIDNAKKTGKYTIFSINSNEVEFGLASALLLDNVYLAIGQDNDQIYHEFMVDLGKPLGSYQRIGDKYFRHFEKGKVIVYPLKRRGEIRANL
jgi:hypothetical protein